MLFCRLPIFFQNQFFSKFFFRITIIVSNSLDPDQARHFVGPDLGPNCLQKLSADDTRRQRVINKPSKAYLSSSQLSIKYVNTAMCLLALAILGSIWNNSISGSLIGTIPISDWYDEANTDGSSFSECSFKISRDSCNKWRRINDI